MRNRPRPDDWPEGPVAAEGTRLLTEEQRAAYDYNRSGQAAPETVLTSIRQLRRMLGLDIYFSATR